MRKTLLSAAFSGLAAALVALPAQATIVSVTGPNSSFGSAAAIIGPPSDVLDDVVFNTGMEGFDEAQNVLTSVAYGIDGGGTIAAGTRVSSHMIFLNSQGGATLAHSSVVWTFDSTILGIMSDSGGTLEAASTAELGAAGTNYTVTFAGSGPAAPFAARGLESNDGVGNGPGDGYQLLAPNQLRVAMRVSEPGDWIRVVTASTVPEPGTLAMLGLALVALGAHLLPRRAS